VIYSRAKMPFLRDTYGLGEAKHKRVAEFIESLEAA